MKSISLTRHPGSHYNLSWVTKQSLSQSDLPGRHFDRGRNLWLRNSSHFRWISSKVRKGNSSGPFWVGNTSKESRKCVRGDIFSASPNGPPAWRTKCRRDGGRTISPKPSQPFNLTLPSGSTLKGGAFGLFHVKGDKVRPDPSEKGKRLFAIRAYLDESEEKSLSPWACLSRHAIRKKEERKVSPHLFLTYEIFYSI